MEGYRPDTYGRRFADVYDDWYQNVSDAGATVTTVSALAGGGPVLELGVGTGRLALPLAACGVPTVGIDASGEMLRVLRTKPGADTFPAVRADMAALPFAPASFAVVFVAYNTFFNLWTAEAQRACLRSVARCLRPDGLFVLEAFVPGDDADAPDQSVGVREMTTEQVVLSISSRDRASQTVQGQLVDITADGIALRPWLLRYETPEGLDAMATEAGLALRDRWADWNGAAFDADSTQHVSVWALASVNPPGRGAGASRANSA